MILGTLVEAVNNEWLISKKGGDTKPTTLLFPRVSVSIRGLAREQALWGALAAGREKEGELWNLNVCIKKVYAKCWLPSADYPRHVFFNVCLHSHSFPLRADWRKSDSSIDGEPKGNWRWNSNSRDVGTSSLPFPAPLPERPGELACRLYVIVMGRNG